MVYFDLEYEPQKSFTQMKEGDIQSSKHMVEVKSFANNLISFHTYDQIKSLKKEPQWKAL